MTNLEQFLEFLEENEGAKMKIGYHLEIGAIYSIVENWTLETQAVTTSIIHNNQTFEFIHDDIEEINVDPEMMNVFIDSENTGFEIHSKGITIGFELIQ